MQQKYHSNATTNEHIRGLLQTDSSLSNQEIASKFNISLPTVSKWKNRSFTSDASCTPKNIGYALSDVEAALAVSIRSATWLPLDEVFETLLLENPKITRGAVYRCFVKNKINKVPIPEKEKAKKFKAYEPNYLHIDVTYA